MKKFEYKILNERIRNNDFHITKDDLNEFGKEGWELISVIFDTEREERDFYFKRELTT